MLVRVMHPGLLALCVALSLLIASLAGLGGEASAQRERQGPAAEGASQAWPDPEESSIVSALTPQITTVVTGGCWSQGARDGFYRVVVYQGGFEELYHHLYAQFVEIDAERHEFRVLKTEPIKETAGFALVFQNLRLSPQGTTCGDAVFEADVNRRTLDGDRYERAQLRLTPSGTYTVAFDPAIRSTPAP